MLLGHWNFPILELINIFLFLLLNGPEAKDVLLLTKELLVQTKAKVNS